MKRINRIHIKHKSQLKGAAERFADHEDMSETRVLRWLAHFPDRDIRLALRVLQAIRYLNATNIRGMTKQLFNITLQELTDRQCRKITFLAVGEAGSGSAIVARALRDGIRRDAKCQMRSMLDMANLKPGDTDAIVFIDDFSGTGDTLTEWWENIEPIIRPLNAIIIVGLLVVNSPARAKIESFAESILAVTELTAQDNVFADASNTFSKADKRRLLTNCRRTGCGKAYEKGYGECGILFAFKHGCPNNSLPLLWYETPKWSALFNRRAI